MKLSRWVYASCTCLILSPFALANDNESTIDDRWLLAKYDANGDHVISIDEVSSERERIFSGMDLNQDGDVTFDEYESLDAQNRQLLLKARFNRLDLNRDGQLSAKEYRSYLGSFDRFDQNGDGQITRSEMSDDKVQAQKPLVATKKADKTACLLWFCVRKNIR